MITCRIERRVIAAIVPQRRKAVERWLHFFTYLSSDELILVPGDGQFEFAVLVQIADDVDVVVQINSAVVHHEAYPCDVRSVEESPFRSERLAEHLKRRLDGHQADS